MLRNMLQLNQILSLLLLSLQVSGWIVSAKSSDSTINFIPWGKECKQTSSSGFLLPHEECDQSKGIFCQKYSQGLFCGCKLDTSQSYDTSSGECRKMPNHNCAYVDVTANPDILQNYPYHVKCHSTADCVLVSKNKDNVGVCRCKPNYVLSRDKLQCSSATGGVNAKTPISILTCIVGAIGLILLNRRT